MNIFSKSLMYNLNNNRNGKNFIELSKQYVKGATINKTECAIILTKLEYTTERFLILALSNGGSLINDASVIVCYDFKSKVGNVMMTCDLPNKSFIINKAKGLVIDGINYINVEMVDFEDDTGNLNIDDYFEDIGLSVIKYFDVINDGDDETVYSQLNASLMKLSKIMNLWMNDQK